MKYAILQRAKRRETRIRRDVYSIRKWYLKSWCRTRIPQWYTQYTIKYDGSLKYIGFSPKTHSLGINLGEYESKNWAIRYVSKKDWNDELFLDGI